jgi:dihydropteroate synthase
VEVLHRTDAARIISAEDAPAEVLARLTAPRPAVAGIAADRPSLMGVLNITPDSFSDGGEHATFEAATARALEMAAEGADIIDIGGESTRPGAEIVPAEAEVARTIPVIEALIGGGLTAPVSIDTRKAAVARAAMAAGARLFNDVSALSFDPESLAAAAGMDVPVCLMHAQGDPKTMQANPTYEDVLLDVYDFLAARVAVCEAAGIARDRLILDVGIGFGKTLQHNLTLLRGLSLFHALGCPLLLGVSRKRFIGTISGVAEAGRRAPGSIAGALWGVGQGAQIIRVHDVAETHQALAVWRALQEGYDP